jgi:hypothetical protein
MGEASGVEASLQTVIQANVAFEAIALGLVGVLLALYAQFAAPANPGDRRPAILRPLGLAIKACAGAAVFAAACLILTMFAVITDTETRQTLLPLVLGLFLVEAVAGPVVAGYLSWRLVR